MPIYLHAWISVPRKYKCVIHVSGDIEDTMVYNIETGIRDGKLVRARFPSIGTANGKSLNARLCEASIFSLRERNFLGDRNGVPITALPEIRRRLDRVWSRSKIVTARLVKFD